MTQPPATEAEREPVKPELAHNDFDPEEEPVGTLALLTFYLILVIGLWIAVYVTLLERS